MFRINSMIVRRGLVATVIGIAVAGVLSAVTVMSREPRENPPALTMNQPPPQSAWVKSHRVVIQISQKDPALMNLALNNAENLVAYYRQKHEPVAIEFVAFGAGLGMVRDDTSPVKQRLAGISRSLHEVRFSGCGNSLATQSRQEGHPITLLPQAQLVPSGVARIVELEEQGWTYLRP